MAKADGNAARPPAIRIHLRNQGLQDLRQSANVLEWKLDVAGVTCPGGWLSGMFANSCRPRVNGAVHWLARVNCSNDCMAASAAIVEFLVVPDSVAERACSRTGGSSSQNGSTERGSRQRGSRRSIVTEVLAPGSLSRQSDSVPAADGRWPPGQTSPLGVRRASCRPLRPVTGERQPARWDERPLRRMPRHPPRILEWRFDPGKPTVKAWRAGRRIDHRQLGTNSVERQLCSFPNA